MLSCAKITLRIYNLSSELLHIVFRLGVQNHVANDDEHCLD